MSDQTQPIEVRVVGGVEASIKNWADSAKKPYVKNTTIRTYIVDPANVNARYVQIAEYEPNRVRMAIQVIDVAVVLCGEQPVTSPDTTSASQAPTGQYLPPNVAAQPYEYFGPDAWWLNGLTAVTRVTVVKEYC